MTTTTTTTTSNSTKVPKPTKVKRPKPSSNRYIKRVGNEWLIVQKDTDKVLSRHDSRQKAQASFRKSTWKRLV